MRIEHVAISVTDPAAVAAWYSRHLGLRVVRKMDTAPFMHFLADSGDNVMIEIYNNPKVKVPDYRSMDPLLLHIAFASDDLKRDREKLLAAGCTPEGEILLLPALGDELAMLRDPWGLAIQLAKRSKPMI